MPNSYFQFKQFRVDQGGCAMKVSTEACIFGAWIPVEDIEANSILDIGAGTGLLSLMLAQRTHIPIEAIEIDIEAAQQCKLNFDNSPWMARLQLHTGNVFEFAKGCNQYDLIVSNPPFYTASLKSDSSTKNLAKHDTGDFNKKDFAKCINQLLSNTGSAYILYPKLEADEFTSLAEGVGLFVREVLVIRNQSSKAIFRVVLQVSKQAISDETEILNIRQGQNHTAQFEELLKDYYLKL